MTWIILLLLLSIPLGQLSRIELTPGVHVYVHDLAVIALSGIVLVRHFSRKAKATGGKLTSPASAFMIVAAFSLLPQIPKLSFAEFATGALYLIRWILYLSIYVTLLELQKQKKSLILFGRKYRFEDALLLSGVSFTVFALIQYVIQPDLTWLKWLGWDDHLGRLVGTLLDPGYSGMLLTLTFLLLVAEELKKPLKGVLAVLVVAALVLTYSRASYLAFLAGTMTYLFLKKKMQLNLMIIAAFIGVLPFLPKARSEGTNLPRTYSLLDRIESWNQGLEIARAKPFFGHGFNLLKSVKKDLGFITEDEIQSHSVSGIENSFIFTLATTGVVGLGIFLWLLWTIGAIASETKESDLSRCLYSSVVAVSVHALFTNTWFYPWVMMWIWYLTANVEGSTLRK